MSFESSHIAHIEIPMCEVSTIKVLPQFDFYNWQTDQYNSCLQEFVRLASEAKCILDVGAHVGLYTIPAALNSPATTEIYSFEPTAANLEMLRTHLQLNGVSKVRVLPLFVGESSNPQKLLLLERGIGGNNTAVELECNCASTMVESITLDEFVRQRNIAPDLIKIDVEGWEVFVVKGAKELLNRFRPRIVLSIHPNHIKRSGSDLSEMRQLFKNYGYQFLDCDRKEVRELEFGEYLLLPKE